jgi:hypothetical protein
LWQTAAFRTESSACNNQTNPSRKHLINASFPAWSHASVSITQHHLFQKNHTASLQQCSSHSLALFLLGGLVLLYANKDEPVQQLQELLVAFACQPEA